MRGLLMIGAAALLAGCVSSPMLEGTWRAPSFEALQKMCSAQVVDYGPDAQGVYAAVFDAYVASRRGGLSKEDFCAFQATIAQRHASEGVSTDPQVRNRWVEFFIDQRAKALSWRASVDPTLRSG
jgi:hypothetical protein